MNFSRHIQEYRQRWKQSPVKNFLRNPFSKSYRAYFKGFTTMFAVVGFFFCLFFVLNTFIQLYRKPAEILNAFNDQPIKTVKSMWEDYGDKFKSHSTPTMTPEFLAALAYVESAGNPVATPEWIVRLSFEDWTKLYAPASSAVGLMQITDGYYREAQKFCIHKNAVKSSGPWYEISGCWFNSFYLRIWPSHAIEMTSAYLDHRTHTILTKRKLKKVKLRHKQELAAILHLCGMQKALDFIKHGFSSKQLGTCGAHSIGTYLKKIKKIQKIIAKMNH